MAMWRYMRLAWRFFCISASREMQYRAHFFGACVSSLAHILLFLVFIETVLSQVEAIGAWGRPQMRILYGIFVFVYGIAEFAIQPNIEALSETIRRGELDFVFTKPVDAQLYVSLQHYYLPALANIGVGALIMGYGLLSLPFLPNATTIVLFLLQLVCSILIIYSLWLLSVLFVFKAIRIDSISYLFIPIAQFARYPINAYPRFLQAVFQFVLPLVFVATVPAETLLGLGTLRQLGLACLAAGLSLFAARIGWLLASRSYVSASS